MLDLTTIPVVDNHCHSVLSNQHMGPLDFRRYFTEGTASSLAEKHIHNTVYYLWMLRQMATFYGCQNTEEDILAARNNLDADTLIERLYRAADIATVDLYPALQPPD